MARWRLRSGQINGWESVGQSVRLNLFCYGKIIRFIKPYGINCNWQERESITTITIVAINIFEWISKQLYVNPDLIFFRIDEAFITQIWQAFQSCLLFDSSFGSNVNSEKFSDYCYFFAKLFDNSHFAYLAKRPQKMSHYKKSSLTLAMLATFAILSRF